MSNKRRAQKIAKREQETKKIQPPLRIYRARTLNTLTVALKELTETFGGDARIYVDMNGRIIIHIRGRELAELELEGY